MMIADSLQDPKSRIGLTQIFLHPFFRKDKEITALCDDGLVFRNGHSKPGVVSSNHPAVKQEDQQVPKPSKGEKDAEKQYPGFSTIRLKPLKQNTKHGTIEILKDGRLALEFNGDLQLMVISHDGSKVIIEFEGQRHVLTSITFRSTFMNQFKD